LRFLSNADRKGELTVSGLNVPTPFPNRAIGLHDLGSLAVIGLSKNAGKTVAIQRLMREASALGRRIGLVSTGMDGESRDAVFGFRKPAVEVAPGALVASAREGLESGSAAFDDLGDTGLQTPFGPIALARVREAGTVTLIGPRTRRELERLMGLLREEGAGLVLVDGSIDRRAAAAATSVQAVVLVVGAAASRELLRVIHEARRVVRLLLLPAWEGPDLSGAVESGELNLLDADGAPVAALGDTALGREDELARALARQPGGGLLIPGALTEALIDALVANGAASGRALVVESGVRVFASSRALDDLDARGCLLRALQPLPLVGLAVNPVSPAGYTLPPNELRSGVQALAPDLPVFDALAD
jgi:hypothetical protein